MTSSCTLSPCQLLPHRPPLLLLDSVEFAEPERAQATLTLRADNPFMGENGMLERAAYAEIIAQCYAAAAGNHAEEGKPPRIGYLAALRDVHLLEDAFLGDKLRVTTHMIASLGGITVVEGNIYCKQRLLAHGQCKVFVEKAEA